MFAAFLLIGAAATLPTAAEVRDPAYVGAVGGLCGDRPCARDPNIAEVRDVACHTAARDEVVCDYLFRVGNRGAFEAVSDTLYRDLSNNNWYLDDNDDDDAIQPTSSKTRR
jgi:hypothetical protein